MYKLAIAPLAGLAARGAALAILAIGPAAAQGIRISPITVALAGGAQVSVIEVTNQNADPITMQVRPFAWSQPDGADRLEPTDVLEVSPPITQIGGGETQTIRLVLRRPNADAAGGAAYRLLIDQLPPPAGAGTIQIALRFSVPVFAEAAAAAGPRLDWRVAMTPGGATLAVSNHAVRHCKVLNATLTLEHGAVISVPTGRNPYVLAGAERSWPIGITGPVPRGTRARLVALLDSGPIDVSIPVGEER